MGIGVTIDEFNSKTRNQFTMIDSEMLEEYLSQAKDICIDYLDSFANRFIEEECSEYEIKIINEAIIEETKLLITAGGDPSLVAPIDANTGQANASASSINNNVRRKLNKTRWAYRGVGGLL